MLGISFRNNMIKRFLGSPNIGKIRHFKDLTRNICLNCCISKMWSLICLAIFLFKPVKYCFKYWVSKYVSVLFLDNIIFAPNKILIHQTQSLRKKHGEYSSSGCSILKVLCTIYEKKKLYSHFYLYSQMNKKKTQDVICK